MDAKDTQRDLQESNEIVNAMADALIVVDPEAIITRVNPAFYRLWGYSEEEVIGKSTLVFFPERELPKHQQELKQAAKTATTRQFETLALTKNGNEIPVLLSGTATIDDQSQLKGFIAVVKDIGELKQTQEALRKAKDELIAQQSSTIIELSTPVIQVWDKILILPLIGTIDTKRAQQIIENLLEAIVDTQSEVTIIDITGVLVVDTSVADHLLKTVEAARMLGAYVIVTGVSSHNAQTLVRLGVDLSNISTKNSLQAGLKAGFELTEYKVIKTTRHQ